MLQPSSVDFTPSPNLLSKAAAYVDSLELFLTEREKAIAILKQALKTASPKLKRDIILLLGGYAKQEAGAYLYPLVADPQEYRETRRLAALVLSVISAGIEEKETLAARLIKQLEHSDSELRMSAAVALGWDSNLSAVEPLFNLLDDPDRRVRQSAVIALANINYPRTPKLLMKGLEYGTLNQKRVILINLWRFFDKKSALVPVYLKYLYHRDPQLRLLSLACFGTIGETAIFAAVYRRCLSHFDARIRAEALRRLADAHSDRLRVIQSDIEQLLQDSSEAVRQHARQVLDKLQRVVS